MIRADILNNSGIDYEAGLEHFMGDESLYERVLQVYIKDDVIIRARKAFDQKDKEGLLSAVHEAKGTSGNTNLMEVYEYASAVVDLLRSEYYTEEQLSEAFLKFEKKYLESLEAIKAAIG